MEVEASKAVPLAVLVALAEVARGPFLAGKEAAMAAVVKVAKTKDGSTCRGSCMMRSNWSCSP